MEYKNELGEFLQKFPSPDKVKVVINDTYWVLGCRRSEFKKEGNWKYYKVLMENYAKEKIVKTLIEFDTKGFKVWKVYIENENLDMDLIHAENIWYEENYLTISYQVNRKKKGGKKNDIQVQTSI